MRHAAKRDSSEKAIFDALVKAGCDVERGTQVDLYVKAPDHWAKTASCFGDERVFVTGGSFLLEVKTQGSNVKRRQPIQKRLSEIFGAQYQIVTNELEALRAVGL